jgi:hypothetical protein
MAIEVKEVEIGELRFQLSPLNAKDQFHLFRRVAPLMAGLGEGFSSIAAETGRDEDSISDGQVVKIMSPLFKVLSEMSDAECDYIIDKCMSRVRMFNGQQWAPIFVAGRLQYENVIDMSIMMRLTVETLQHNGIVSFFSDAPDLAMPNGASAAMSP